MSSEITGKLEELNDLLERARDIKRQITATEDDIFDLMRDIGMPCCNQEIVYVLSQISVDRKSVV